MPTGSRESISIEVLKTHQCFPESPDSVEGYLSHEMHKMLEGVGVPHRYPVAAKHSQCSGMMFFPTQRRGWVCPCDCHGHQNMKV